MKWIRCLMISSMLWTCGLSARTECWQEIPMGGYGYRASQKTSQCITPAIALGIVALAAIVTVGLHDRSGTSSTEAHAHAHAN